MKKLSYFMFISLIFFITLFIYWFCHDLYCDEIWNYGYAYNIASGLTPYRDFNLLTPPLYHILGAIFIKMLGSSLLSFEIYNSIIVTIIMFFLFCKFGKLSLILFPILLCYMLPNYNFLSLAFLIIIMVINYCSESFYKYYYIGILIGMIFCTKQTIGILFFIIMIIFSKKRIKSLIGFLIPICILFLYLIYNDCFFEFINYNFGSLISFGESNTFIGIHILIFIPMLIYLFIRILQTKFKDFSLLLVFAYQCVSFPIFDRSHIMLGVVAVIVYLLIIKKNYFEKYFKYYFIISVSLLLSILAVPSNNYHLYNDKSSFMNGKAVWDISYDYALTRLEKKISSYRDNYDYIFIYSYHYFDLAYAVKLNMNIPINKFDMICNGNMGYNGVNRFLNELEELCSESSCLFFVDNVVTNDYTQTNMKILNFGTQYDLIDSVNCGNIEKDHTDLVFNIYSNNI